jgi:hypothetical protein
MLLDPTEASTARYIKKMCPGNLQDWFSLWWWGPTAMVVADGGSWLGPSPGAYVRTHKVLVA